MNQTWNGKTALITGASSGIGAAIARRFAAGGLRVLLTARRLERLHALAEEIRLAGGAAETLPADLAIEVERVDLFRQVNAQFGCPHVLVNNAGFGWYGYLSEMPWRTMRDLIAVNVEAAAHLARLCLPGMLARNSGHILNIGSIAGKIPSQGIAMYAGSKAFLDAFSTALHRELAGSGVQVSLLRPGPVRTEFFDISEQQVNGGRIPAERFAIRAERVAEAAFDVLQRPRRALYVPWYLGVVPVIEGVFGWLMDSMGPLLLRRRKHQSYPHR